METAKTLYLNLKKAYFDAIKNGEKTAEFRDYKEHWIRQLMHSDGSFKHYDFVLFRNGYHKNAPQMIVECKGINIIKERMGWFRRKKYFKIELGKIIHLKNTTSSRIE